MSKSASHVDTYLEIGQKRVFAGAIDWPGWCRSGRDEESALRALLDYGPRYARVLRATRLGFQAPTDVKAFRVVERLKGNATTDFGAPGIAPPHDARRVPSDELLRFEKLLKACWRAFDAAVKKASGKELRTGPRGGGRQVEGVIRHLLESDSGYIKQVGWKVERGKLDDPDAQLERLLQLTLSALKASAGGEIPAKGPRGGIHWTARYFVRRIAWHTLDHAWEVEDRLKDK